MAEGVETRLRQELGGVKPPTPDLDRVARRARTLRARRWAAGAVVAALVAAGVALPLLALSRFGSERERTPAGPVHAVDLSVDVPDGWDSRLVTQDNGALRLEVTNYPLPAPEPTGDPCAGFPATPMEGISCEQALDVAATEGLHGVRTPDRVTRDIDRWVVEYDDVLQPLFGPPRRPAPDCSLGPWSVEIDAETGRYIGQGGSGFASVPCDGEGARLGADQVRMVVLDQSPEIVPDDVDVGDAAAYRDEDFQPVEGSVVLGMEHFGARFESTPEAHSLALRNVRVNGVPLTVWAEFGSDPAPADLLRRVNEILATLRVTPAREEPTSPEPPPEQAKVGPTIGPGPDPYEANFLPPWFEPAEEWHTATTGPLDPDFDQVPLAWAANVPFAQADLQASREAGTLLFRPAATLRSLGADGIVIIAAISNPGEWPADPGGVLPEASLPLSLADADVRRSWEGQVAPNVPEYVLWRTVDGWQVDVRVYFGTFDPSLEVLAEAQEQLDRLRLPDPPEPEEPTVIHADVDDGVKIEIPASWTWHEDPSGPDDPKTLFAAGTWPFAEGGDCAPTAAQAELPADGALFWVLEYLYPETTEFGVEFPDRPPHFELDPATRGTYECSTVPSYVLRFNEFGRDGRLFQIHVAFGPDATDETRRRVLVSLDSLVVTAPVPETCPAGTGPWSDPDCPAPVWVRAFVEEAGYRIVGDTGSALVVDAPGDGFHVWAFVPEDDRGLEDALNAEGYVWWRGFGTDVYSDGVRVAWEAHGLRVYLSGRLDELPSAQVIEAVVQASLAVDYDAIDTRPR